ncbi:hypothetical protein MY012_10500 [Escherichia coli]|nr:hypothetical protein MY012_10500 [Escherichia coli]
MSKIEINRITNANIYLDGTNLLGRAEEVKLPRCLHDYAGTQGAGDGG